MLKLFSKNVIRDAATVVAAATILVGGRRNLLPSCFRALSVTPAGKPDKDDIRLAIPSNGRHHLHHRHFSASASDDRFAASAATLRYFFHRSVLISLAFVGPYDGRFLGLIYAAVFRHLGVAHLGFRRSLRHHTHDPSKSLLAAGCHMAPAAAKGSFSSFAVSSSAASHGRSSTATMILANAEVNQAEDSVDIHVLPAMQIGCEGVLHKSYVTSMRNPTAQIIYGVTAIGRHWGLGIALFSSRGPSVNNPSILKPDVIGLGVSILAVWPSNLGPCGLAEDTRRVGFTVLSGTSRYYPHVSSISVLIREAHSTWHPRFDNNCMLPPVPQQSHDIPETSRSKCYHPIGVDHLSFHRACHDYRLRHTTAAQNTTFHATVGILDSVKFIFSDGATALQERRIPPPTESPTGGISSKGFLLFCTLEYAIAVAASTEMIADGSHILSWSP